jgi:hypothetical protein
MDVVQALDASQALKNDLITAATIQGQVTLSGTVSSLAESELAASIAGHVNGVSKINNNLKVGNPQDAQDAAAPATDDEMPPSNQGASAAPSRSGERGSAGRPGTASSGHQPARTRSKSGSGSATRSGPTPAPVSGLPAGAPALLCAAASSTAPGALVSVRQRPGDAAPGNADPVAHI